jgi:hypothetical protein
MATATLETPTLEQLEAKRNRLLVRKAELEEMVNACPATIAQARETYYRSESPARKRTLDHAIDAQRAAEVDLLEVNAGLETVDRFIGQEMAKRAEARAAEVRAEADEIVQRQRAALMEFGEWFASGYPLWVTYTEAVLALDAVWRAHPQMFGNGPPRAGGLAFPGQVLVAARAGGGVDASRLVVGR